LTSPCPISYMSRNFGNWTTISCSFSQFFAAHAQKRPEFYFRSNFLPQIWNPHGLFPIRIRILREKLLSQCNEEYWGRGEIFLTKPPKGTSLPDFTRFEPSIVQIRSRVFAGCVRKKRTLQKVTVTYLWGIPHLTKFNQNWHMGRRRNQSYQVW